MFFNLFLDLAMKHAGDVAVCLKSVLLGKRNVLKATSFIFSVQKVSMSRVFNFYSSGTKSNSFIEFQHMKLNFEVACRKSGYNSARFASKIQNN